MFLADEIMAVPFILGKFIAGVADDFWRVTRKNPPDIGAYENANVTPVNYILTVNSGTSE